MTNAASWLLKSSFLLALACFGFARGARADSVVVFNEIMYHPLTNEPALEWLELYNQMAVDVDLSGWSISDGIDYTFPDQAVIKAGGWLVVAISPTTLMAQTGLTNVLGPFSGRLSNSGENLDLRDNNHRLMDSVNYGTDGKWPVGPDGAGASLAKKSPNLPSGPAENWTVSAQIGGTPGAANFPTNSATLLPKLAFNEVAAATNTGFWLEIINFGPTNLALAGVQVVRSSGGTPSYAFPAQTLPPGGIVALTQAQLGFSAVDGNKLMLYTPGRSALLDAVTVKTTLRGRHPDGLGAWMAPSQPTPGASNVFSLHDEIVFNEIMYHHRPFDPAPAVTTNLTVISITNGWRFNDTGADLGSAWRAVGYDDSSWASGAALMSINPATLPAPVNTYLAPGRGTYYFRSGFNFGGAATNVSLNLRAIVADGAVFYVNGVEVSRMNLPAGGVTYSTAAVTNVPSPGYAPSISVPLTNLVPGLNLLAVEVHPFAGPTNASGLVLSGGGLQLVEEGPFGGSPPMNLAQQSGAAPFVIDSLAGFPMHNFVGLTDGTYGNQNSWIGNSGSPGYAGVRFGGLYTISSFAFGRDNTGVYPDRTLGLYTLQYTRVATPDTTTPATEDPATGWATIGTLNYQSAGAGLFTSPSLRHRFTFSPVTATGLRLLVPGTGLNNGTCIDEIEVNPPDQTRDVAFGAELVLTTTNVPAMPFTKSTEEWVELYNRGSNAVNLTGWRVDGGIGFSFTNGPVIPTNDYLVVASDAAALRLVWPEVAGKIVGNFSGKLGGGDQLTLKDSLDNTVNAATVFAGGWSDGGGSSLELIDPWADNGNPNAWADSDETSRSAWQTNTYRAVAGQTFGSEYWNEFRLGLLDAGEALVDDVSVIRDPDGVRQQLIQNGSFETTAGNTHWRCLGDHAGSQLILDPDNAANHVLKVSATAAPRTSHNHVESSFVSNTAIVDGQTYEVSFRARWRAGSPQLNTSAYFARLARTTFLPQPSRNGTPGAANSRRIANAGPTFSGLAHTPIIPQTNQAVLISVQAADPDGVASVTLKYRLNPSPTFNTTNMTLQTNGVWTAPIPAQAAGAIVQFYVVGVDTRGATAFAPAQGTNSRALYQVADGQGAALPAHEMRLIMLSADRDFMLNSTNVLSQGRLGGTLIYDRAEVFYDVAARLEGSPAGRARDGDDYINYDIAFPPNHLFRGVQANVGIDRSGRAPVVRHQDEIYILHMFHHAALPCQYSDLCYFIAPKTNHTGTAILQLAVYDGTFTDEQYNQDGTVFNMDGTYEPATTVDGNFESLKLPVPFQTQVFTDFTDLSSDPEQYRAPFEIRHNERADDFSGLIRLAQTMSLPQAQFDAQISTALDVDEALAIAALTRLCGIDDMYYTPGAIPQHNVRIFTPTDGSPAQLLPWDMDFVFTTATSSSIYFEPSRNLYKLINNPATQRLYLGHVYDLCQNVFNPTYMNAWLAHYGSVVGQDYSSGSSYIQNRRAYALGQLPAAQPFAITSNQGQDILTSATNVIIAGTGWVDIHQISLLGTTNPLAITWTSLTSWQITLPVAYGTNAFSFVAYDQHNLVLATNHINVVRADLPSVAITLPSGSPANLPAGVGLVLQATLGNASNITWSALSGPGAISFGNTNTASTTATFPATGTYILRCQVTSGPFNTNADLTVNVLAPPAPWTAQIVGAATSGSHTLSNGVFQISAAGAGIPSASVPDNFYFIDQTMNGDVEITARIVSVDNINGSNSRAGVMVRESIAADARHVFAGENSLASGRFVYRTSPGAVSAATTGNGGFPYWVKLTRATNLFTGLLAPDNSGAPGVWTTVGAQTLVLSNTVYVGLVATSGASATNAQVVIDHVTVTHGANVGPLVNAGPDQVTTTATNVLTGAVSDDGLPNPPAAVSAWWTQLSGPGPVIFANTNTPNPAFTLPASGQYQFRLLADDGQIRTFDDLTVNLTLPWDAWRAAHFTAAELTNSALSSELADPDGDGIKNLAEYALGTDPHAANPLPVKVELAGGVATLTYQKNLAATDLTLRLEESLDLKAWSPVTASPQIVSTQGQLQTLRVQIPVSGTATFWRIVVVK